MRETLFTLLEAGASGAPESDAILDIQGTSISYKGLLNSVLTLADTLTRHGIRRGDRVAWVMPNGPEAAVAFLAISMVAASVPIRATATFEEVRLRLESTRTRAIVTLNDLAFEAAGAAETLHLPILRLRGFGSTPKPDPLGTAVGCAALDQARWVPPQPDDVAIVLPAKDPDTDPVPDQILLTHGSLVHAARNIAHALGLHSKDRCLNVMPLEGMHGLVGCLLSSLACQASVICTPGFRINPLSNWITQLKPTWISAVPAMYQAWMEQLFATHEQMPEHPLRFVRACSAPLPARLFKELEDRLRAPVIEAYSLSTAGHQIASNPLPPRLRKPGSVGLPTGTQVAVVDETGTFLPPDQTGEIVVKGDSVPPGSVVHPALRRNAFIHGWYRTGDLGRLDTDGYLYLSGRSHDVIHRGEHRILPREVEAVLLTHPSIAEATCFPRPHPTLGEDLIAAVVLREGVAATEKGIRAFAFDRLPHPKVPSRILILDQLPQGPSGKVQRHTLAQRLANHFHARPVAPRDDLEGLVAEIWTDVLESQAIGVNDDFFGLGGDSVRAARIVTRINDLFQLALPVTALFRHPTVSQFTDELKRLTHPALLETIAQNVHDLGALSHQDVLELLSSAAGRA